MVHRIFLVSVAAILIASSGHAEKLPTPVTANRERIDNCRDAISYAMTTPYVERSPCSSPARPNTTCDVTCTDAPGGWIVAASAGGSTWRCRLYVTFDAFTEAQLPCGLQTPAP